MMVIMIIPEISMGYLGNSWVSPFFYGIPSILGIWESILVLPQWVHQGPHHQT